MRPTSLDIVEMGRRRAAPTDTAKENEQMANEVYKTSKMS